jgi:hypothetical protein
VQVRTEHYRLLKKIKDDRFEEEALQQYQLFLNIGVRDFQVLVVADDQRVLLLEDYVLPEVSSPREQLASLQDLFESHAVLSAGFWGNIRVSFKTQKFVQVPAALFNEDSMLEYLMFNAQVDEQNETILKTHHNKQDTVTVFAVPTDLIDWLSSLYPNSKPVFLHQSAVLIEGVLTETPKYNNNTLYVYIDRFKLHIISCNKGKLVYYNQFAINQFQDYVRYIMLVMKSLKMDQHTSQVVLWGYIGKNSPHYHEFYKFINNVSFGSRPASLRFGYFYDELQEQNFFDLFSINLIAKA